MKDLHEIHTDESGAVPAAFSITVEPQRDRVRLAPCGELDLSTVSQLERELAELLRVGFERVTIDLGSVEFIDSTGLHFLLAAHAEAERDGWQLRILPGPAAVQRLFELTSTLDRLPFVVGVL